MQTFYLIVPLAPLLGALAAGLLGPVIGRRAAHSVTIALMVVSFGAALAIFGDVLEGNEFNGPVYNWLVTDGVRFDIGFLIDRLSATMMVVVTFISLAVHVYTIGYMADDPGYQRFFSYISLFTFSMLMLVMANNFVQLFFGWEAVGLVSYLLIGFWYTRPSAIYANLKAFLVNRVGDFGFLLGIALVLLYAGSLDYVQVFSTAERLATTNIEIFSGHAWSVASVICILLFIGAMGKSAQFPLHVWLPDSMEGPTPISALIHAATMVTAGIFMVARMSPLFELSEAALAFVIVIGAITALFMGLVAIVQNDIKRVIAYSTLSQLGYMTVALGASAYSAAIFHLATHAFFKAVLFLGAGSVIIAMHHEQDMRRMGGLRHYMPITYWTMVIASLAIAGVPGLSGFFSKDAIIEATKLSTTAGAGFAYFSLTACVFVTAVYTFRLVFMTFHGTERFNAEQTHEAPPLAHGEHVDEHHAHSGAPHESPQVVTWPLIALSIPAVCLGWLIGPVLFGDFFGGSIVIAQQHPGLSKMGEEFHGVLGMVWHAVFTAPFWFSIAGIVTAWYLYIKRPDLPAVIATRFGLIYRILDKKYGFDEFNEWFFARGARALGRELWQRGDVGLIDGLMVNGSARFIGWCAGLLRQVQSGFIYHYAFTMIIGVLLLVTLTLLFMR